jgi:hypothetical protein
MAGKTLAVYAINQHKGKDYWTRVGAAFENRDGSLNLVLNCIPLNGKLQVREAPEKEGG